MNSKLEEKPTALFTGIYGIPESAQYLSHTPPFTNGHRIEPARLRYWIRTSLDVAPSPFPARQRLITFLDLISMRMIALMRSNGVRLREIRNHEKWLRKEFGITQPFVSQQLWTLGSHVYMKFHDRLWASSKFGQQAMRFMEDWLTKVELDMEFDEYQIASSWSPFYDVRLDPKIQLGEPCIDGTRIPTSIIWSRYQARDKPEIIAKSIGITLSQVEHAMDWEKRLVTT